MDAGYDYLLLRGRLSSRLLGVIAVFLVALGVLLVGGSGAYYAYAAKARADLAELNASLREQAVPDSTGTGGSSAAARTELPGISPEGIASQDLRLGGPLDTYAWSDPLGYEPTSYLEEVLLSGFTPMSVEQALPVGSQPAVTRIMVPALGIDSSVTELGILDLADSRAYQTPANEVGHIPDSASAGEAGSAWFFGHLESPVLGEGSVFYHLPAIPEKLKQGEDVYVVTDNGAQQYLYRITSTQVVHESYLALYDSGRANIHLVACVPRLVYDHRLVVTGELVGVK